VTDLRSATYFVIGIVIRNARLITPTRVGISCRLAIRLFCIALPAASPFSYCVILLLRFAPANHFDPPRLALLGAAGVSVAVIRKLLSKLAATRRFLELAPNLDSRAGGLHSFGHGLALGVALLEQHLTSSALGGAGSWPKKKDQRERGNRDAQQDGAFAACHLRAVRARDAVKRMMLVIVSSYSLQIRLYTAIASGTPDVNQQPKSQQALALPLPRGHMQTPARNWPFLGDAGMRSIDIGWRKPSAIRCAAHALPLCA
jgi:hypothetical protein